MDAAATLLAPAKHVDGYYEFWPQDFIVSTAAGAATGQSAPVGVVQSVNHDQRICVITWREDGKREVVPVYEIVSPPRTAMRATAVCAVPALCSRVVQSLIA